MKKYKAQTYNQINFNGQNGMLHLYICDQASEKGPSGHIKFKHFFQICCIITIKRYV